MDEVKIKIEKAFRLEILQIAENAKAADGTAAEILRYCMEDRRDMQELGATTPTAIDEVIARLAKDLVNLGLLTVTDLRKFKHERPSPKLVVYAITAKGTALLAGAIPVEPLVEDERIS